MVKKRILVTGIAGFIGFHTAKKLFENGHFVIGLDNFNDYYEVNLKEDRAKILAQMGVSIKRGDVTSADFVLHLLEEHSITHIVHLAAQAGVRHSFNNPQSYIHANIDGFLSILEACRKHPEIPLVYASTSSVYGTNTKIPFSVEDRTDGPSSLYAVTKKTNELMAYSYGHLFGIQTIGLRFFTVYGPWGRPDMSYFLFTKAAFEKKVIQVHDIEHMGRDFTYIDDVVDGILSAIEYAKSGIFNIGNSNPEPLRKLIELIEKETGTLLEKKHLPMHVSEVAMTYADIKETTNILKFYPKISLEEGISRFVAWYKNYYNV